MTTPEAVLMVAVLAGLFTTWRRSPRWLNLLPAGIAALAAADLALSGYREPMLRVYLVVAALLGVALWRQRRPSPAPLKPRHGTGLLIAILGRALAVLALIIAFREVAFYSLPAADLSQMTWKSAFWAMHERISAQYAFGAWKRIDWDALYAAYAPQVAAAEAQGDREAYYLALRSYAASIPDGHVWLKGDDGGAKAQRMGGGYGLGILGLDDGRVIAVTVSPEGAAAAAGMAWVAQVLTWNGLPMEAALAQQTPVLWAGRRGAPATAEGLRLAQYRALVRAPAGTEATVSFRNPGASQLASAVLKAVPDGEIDIADDAAEALPPVEEAKVLPSGVGYLKINAEDDDGGRHQPVADVRQAMELFVERDVPGVVLDVRGNRGGDDALVPQFVGYFYSERALYEQATIYFQPLGTFIRRPPVLWIEPLQPHYAGPVVALIDNACFSSGEGIPMAVARLPQGAVIGFYGTYGSFGMTGGAIEMPEGLTLLYPDGQSLDAQGAIQLDSDASMQGGVAPTLRVPMTEETARALYVDGRDVLLEKAQEYILNR